MTDIDKLTAASRALAQIADLVTECILKQAHLAYYGLHEANETLVNIRELAQDAAEATLDKVETRT